MKKPVEAKAKVRARQKRYNDAISAYKSWQRKHPRASFDEQVKMFDLYVDTAALNELTTSRTKEMVKG